jgi:phospholipid transport system substrate-binding protein
MRVKMSKLYKFFVVLVICFLGVSYSNAASSENVKDFVNKVANDALTILKDPKLDDKNQEKKLRELFLSTVDTKWIGKFVLGKHYRTATKEQKNKYENIYGDYLISTYMPNFRKYTSESIKIIGVSEPNKGEFLVQTEIVRPQGQQNIKIDYRIRQSANNELKIFDIIGEGVSLIATQRSEFSSVITNNGMDYLISKLNDRIKSVL